MTSLFLLQLLNGVQLGVLLFLIAAGLTLVFGIMDFVNLAHGVIYMVGAYLVVMFAGLTGSYGLGLLLTLPYVCIGIGSGLFGQGVAGVIERYVYKKYPKQQKLKEIEVNDERNREISTRAKAKAYDAMVFVFGALMISFALMNVEVAVVLLLVFAYLFGVGIGIYYRIKLEKEL